MNKDIFKYLPFHNGYFECNVDVNDIKSKAKFRIVPKLSFSPNDELQNYLQKNPKISDLLESDSNLGSNDKNLIIMKII